MKKMEWFRITERFSYNEFLDVCVRLGELLIHPNELTSELPLRSNTAVLTDGKLTFQSAGGKTEILDEQKPLYYFEINKNTLPPLLRTGTIPVNPDLVKSTSPAAHVTTAEDYVQVAWSLAETWWMIGQLFSTASKQYTFQSREFLIERKVVHNGQTQWEPVSFNEQTN